MLGNETAYAKDIGAPNRAISGAGQSTRLTLQSAIDAAGGTAKLLDDRADALGRLAEQAQDIAIRLAGSYPTEAHRKSEGGEQAGRVPQSSVDAINFSVGDLFPKIERFDPSLGRLAQALGMIERAIG